jgi:hypothetical protein
MLPMLSAATVLTIFVIWHDVALGTVLLSQEWPHALLVGGVTVLAVIARMNRTTEEPGPRRTAWVGGGSRERTRVHRAA